MESFGDQLKRQEAYLKLFRKQVLRYLDIKKEEQKAALQISETFRQYASQQYLYDRPILQQLSASFQKQAETLSMSLPDLASFCSQFSFDNEIRQMREVLKASTNSRPPFGQQANSELVQSAAIYQKNRLNNTISAAGLLSSFTMRQATSSFESATELRRAMKNVDEDAPGIDVARRYAHLDCGQEIYDVLGLKKADFDQKELKPATLTHQQLVSIMEKEKEHLIVEQPIAEKTQTLPPPAAKLTTKFDAIPKLTEQKRTAESQRIGLQASADLNQQIRQLNQREQDLQVKAASLTNIEAVSPQNVQQLLTLLTQQLQAQSPQQMAQLVQQPQYQQVQNMLPQQPQQQQYVWANDAQAPQQQQLPQQHQQYHQQQVQQQTAQPPKQQLTYNQQPPPVQSNQQTNSAKTSEKPVFRPLATDSLASTAPIEVAREERPVVQKIEEPKPEPKAEVKQTVKEEKIVPKIEESLTIELPPKVEKPKSQGLGDIYGQQDNKKRKNVLDIKVAGLDEIAPKKEEKKANKFSMGDFDFL